MNESVLHSVRHEVWADLELLRFCARLSPEQLAWTAPGTYGTIHDTLQHIVRAQMGYLSRLTGAGGPPGLPHDTERLVPISELADAERGAGERIEALLSQPFDPRRVVPTSDGTATAGVVLAQFIHHGSDHRAHVGTVLGANGVQPPNLDVWSYGLSRDEVTVSAQ